MYNGSMKTTVDIPREQLEEAIRHTGARTKREAVLVAISELNRRRRLGALTERFGTCEHLLTHEELEARREAG